MYNLGDAVPIASFPVDELREEEEIVRKYLKDVKKVDKQWTGYLDSDDTLKEFERELASINVSFQTEVSAHPDSEKSRLLFCAKQKGCVLPIELDCPFRITAKCTKGCVFGKERHGVHSRPSDTQSNATPDWGPATFPKRKMKLQGTKKKGCIARMHTKRIEMFPEYKIELPRNCSAYSRKAASKAVMARLESALSSDNQYAPAVAREVRIYVSFNAKDGHTQHDFGMALSFGQPMNAEVSAKINQLVQQGITSVTEVQKCLQFYVEDVLFANKEPPQHSCRTFYPTRDDIRSHIQSAIRKDRYSSVDQVNAMKLIEDLRRKDPTGKYFFQPYKQHLSQESSTMPSQKNDSVLESVASECEQTLMFCMQTAFMESALQKYSEDVVCLDATNKTTDYALPLFFLVVKTPTGYVIVGVFIVQFETSECISAALEVFKLWNPNFCPKYWMIDFSQAEINAINLTFPDSRIALCDFHREQAWERWCRKKENNINDKNQALFLLRKLARAHSAEDFAIALQDMHSSQVWTDNPAFRHYVETQWLPVKKMWATYLRPGLTITTNNGTEAQNKMLKEYYLKSHSGRRSLTGLLQTLHTFLADRQVHFQRKNLQSSSEYRLYHDNIPPYLHNRPRSVVHHIMSRLAVAADFINESITAGCQNGTFLVKSATSEGTVYTVNFAVPSCSCHDFQKHGLPCKHFCAIFLLCEAWGFDQLPQHYRDGPLMALDHGVTTQIEDGHNNCYNVSPMTNADIVDKSGNLALEKSCSQGIGQLKAKVLQEYERGKSLAYYCTDSKALEYVLAQLQECTAQLREGTQATAGLNLRGSPTKGCSGKRSQDCSHKDVSELKKQRTAKNEHWRSRGRVGEKAEILRATYNTAPHIEQE